jgi:hypothetical protein
LTPIFRKIALALAAAAAFNQAQAGVLSFQDVVFTTTWTSKVLTLEIDAARHSGDWSSATMLGALSLKDLGSFTSVSVTAAPNGVDAWTLNSKELNAKGCAGGGAARSGTALCLSGAPIALADNMVFTFTFTGGTPDLDEPHLKVRFVDASKNKVGSLLSQNIASTPVAVAQPVTPPAATPVPATVTPTPVTPLPATPVPATPLPVTPEPAVPVAPVPSAPVTLPSSGNTTVTAPVDNVVVTMPVAGTGTTTSIPVPPPLQVTTPLPVLEPAGQQASGQVPEPQSIALLLGGLLLMAAALRKRG